MDQEDQIKTSKNSPELQSLAEIDHKQTFTESLNQKLDLQNEHLMGMQLDLKEALNNYSELYDFSPVAYFTLKSNGLIIQTNTIGENMLGVKRNALFDKNFSRYIAPDHQFIFTDFLTRINKESSIQSCELKLFKRNGPLYYALLQGKLIHSPKTKTRQILLVVTDINLHNKAVDVSQYQTPAIDSINYVGELAAIIAHELNHPHAVISTYIQGTINLLENGNYPIKDLLQAMKQAAQQLDRAGEIILRMKNFVCKGALNYESLCIHSTINETLALIQYEIQKFPVTVRYMPIRHPLMIMADRIHIQQVILNLARNAFEAMRDNGTPDPRLTIEANHISKNFIEISVLDNGPGLSPVAIHHLFDPHFTTKSYGIGLGLAISRSIVRAHGGELFIEPESTNGCCFKFTLPIEKLSAKPPAYFQ